MFVPVYTYSNKQARTVFYEFTTMGNMYEVLESKAKLQYGGLGASDAGGNRGSGGGAEPSVFGDFCNFFN